MRCFIALPLLDAAKRSIWEASRQLRELCPQLSWVKPEGYHLTLSFLGEQGSRGISAARRTLSSLEEALGREAPPPLAESLSFQPAGLGTFPCSGPGWRVLVLKPCSASAQPISRLHALLAAGLAEEAAAEGLPPLNADWPDASLPSSRPRRPFSAHLTLARAPAGETCPHLEPSHLEAASEALQAMAPGGWPLGALVLYKSDLRSGGAVYTEIERIRLPG